MTKEGATYWLKLRSLDGNNIRGLRWLLKDLLRRHRFRCLSIEEQPSFGHEPEETPPGESGIPTIRTTT
jgi:hypothetical protein